jgi:hypothetical protein
MFRSDLWRIVQKGTDLVVNPIDYIEPFFRAKRLTSLLREHFPGDSGAMVTTKIMEFQIFAGNLSQVLVNFFTETSIPARD